MHTSDGRRKLGSPLLSVYHGNIYIYIYRYSRYKGLPMSIYTYTYIRYAYTGGGSYQPIHTCTPHTHSSVLTRTLAVAGCSLIRSRRAITACSSTPERCTGHQLSRTCFKFQLQQLQCFGNHISTWNNPMIIIITIDIVSDQK